jgi:hypothetical protein
VTPSEKPLHIQVAEALGWTKPYNVNGFNKHTWAATPPKGWVCWYEPAYHGPDGSFVVPDYTLDWDATGPLIEKYEIEIGKEWQEKPLWTACINSENGLTFEDGVGYGTSPLLAVCELILQLRAAGKLSP